MSVAVRRRRRPWSALFATLALFASSASWLVASPAAAATSTDLFLHQAGLTLTSNAPTGSTAAENDSPGVSFAAGNAWRDIGTWAATPAVTNGSLVALSDLHAWLGLRNSDDQGTQFDLRATVFRNGTQLAEGLQRCITSLTRNPSLAREVTVSFGAPTILTFNGTSDVLTLRLSTRIGTTESNAKCTGPGSHNNATGLRLYSDSTSRPARFDATIVPVASAVRINEIESNGGTPGDWVELYNPTASPIDLSYHVFRDNDDSHTYVIPNETTIAGGAYRVLDMGANGTGFDFGLGAPDAARLFAPDGTTLIDSYSWTSHALTTYGRCPNGTGVFKNTTASTKNAANDCSVPVRLNEVESSTNPTGGHDWVELYNPTSSQFDLSGVGFRDNDSTHAIYAIPQGTTIPAGGFYVLEEIVNFSFGLGTADSVNLYLPGAVGTDTPVDTYSWTSHAPDTYGRCPDGTGAFTTTTATRGAPNSCGPVVETNIKINEVESDDGANPDWIELTNIGTATVNIGTWQLKDDTDSHIFTIPTGTTIAGGAYLAFDVSVGATAFGLGSSDQARLFRPDGTIADSTSWTGHASPTWGRCPDKTGSFGNTAVSTKGARNSCAGDATAWPGGTDIAIADNENVFGQNLSGLTYEGSGSANPGVLWAVRNNVGTLFRLVWNGTSQIWTPDTTNDWGTGKALHYNDGTGNLDAEGVTFGPTVGASVFVSTERDNGVSGTPHDSVVRFDPSTVGPTLNATKEWDLTTDLTSDLGATLDSNLGMEGIAWVPDTYLQAHGFVDQSTGVAYSPSNYPNHGTGLFFIGLEQNGKVYVYALNDDATSTFHRVATITTGFPGVMEVQFDRELNNLWAVCDNSCDGQSAILEVNGSGQFAVTHKFARPTGMPNFNNEGFAVATQSECAGGVKPAFWSDDTNDGNHALRQGTASCSPF